MGQKTTSTEPAIVGSYWEESRGPLASLVFVCPLLATYEVGVITLGPYAVRNGADAWLRYLLDSLGFGQYFLLPALTVGALLAWHHARRLPWRIPRGVYLGMAVECLLLAVLLRMILHLQGMAFARLALAAPPMAMADLMRSGLGWFGTLVGYLGAGIYEELAFRLILLSLIGLVLRAAGVRRGWAWAVAVVAASLLFSTAHYIGPYGERLNWFSFLFRFVAGAFFSVLFLYRGFGIAAGAHAGYDILVGLL